MKYGSCGGGNRVNTYPLFVGIQQQQNLDSKYPQRKAKQLYSLSEVLTIQGAVNGIE